MRVVGRLRKYINTRASTTSPPREPAAAAMTWVCWSLLDGPVHAPGVKMQSTVVVVVEVVVALLVPFDVVLVVLDVDVLAVLAVLEPLDADVLAVLAGSSALQMSQNCNVGVPLTLT